ncbi:MAG TPA: ABC transporter permease subunit [Thermoflexia bacterium]|jgi:uncharacterized membrane protein SpoIIM required for sporulation/ABC-type transport system involved in multi-copper enzyme maturation permease subunit|nr:ABC transporter permease subunit [Thermoflexia bacterium]
MRQGWQEELRLIWTLTAREIRDVLRDWRLVTPILLLTLLFPIVATLVAQVTFRFFRRFGGYVLSERMIPFLLMIVGFFPITFSLVIALESFVGEKERKSLEPLLATPLSDIQLYVGKLLSSLIPPLAASYLGMVVYLIGLYFFQRWSPSLELLAQMFALTTAEALVMVSGAVVVSSQTTSVRAANLLASFIILPMAFLVQAESFLMLWGQYASLWWLLAFLLVGDVLLIRMGLRLFNREELLGQEIDVVQIGKLWRIFRRHFAWEWWLFGRDQEEVPRPVRWTGWLAGFYLREVPAILRRSSLAMLVVLAGIVGAGVLGWNVASRYPVTLSLGEPGRDFFGGITPAFILGNNLRALTLAAILGTFSFGSLAVTPLLVTLGLATYLGLQILWSGYSPWVFLALIAPHGILELPAAFLWCAAAVRLGAAFIAPPPGMTVGEGWLQALADFLKIALLVVLPALTIAALIEVRITPGVAMWVFWAYGR